RGLRHTLRGLPPSALAGEIQYRNASTALAAIEALDPRRLGAGFVLDERSASRALGGVRLAGRFQVVAGSAGSGPGEWILDIAHNEPAAKIFAEHVKQRPLPAARGRTVAVVGILGDKDALEIVSALQPLVDHWFLCSLPGPRGGSASQLAQRLGRVSSDRVTLADSVAQACEAARAATGPADRVLIFGSVYTVGPALQWLKIY